MTLDVAVDRPVAFLAARLNEVLPTGESRRVTYAILNLCHRDSDETPMPLTPGKGTRSNYRSTTLHAASMREAAFGYPLHDLLAADSTGARAGRLTLFTGSAHMTLPVRPLRAADRS